MIWKALILVLCLWCTVYTVSYGIFEYKNKNPLGSAVVIALAALNLLATLGIGFLSV